MPGNRITAPPGGAAANCYPTKVLTFRATAREGEVADWWAVWANRSEHRDPLRSARPVASVGASQHRGGGAPRARLRADHRGAPARAGVDGVGGVERSAKWI
jgi:hypothetical protein